MKNLKFAWLFAIGMMAFMTSCDKDDVALSSSNVDGESAVLDLLFLATSEDTTTTESSSNYGHRGKCNVTEVAVEDLSATITDYITANYADATINRAGTNDDNSNTYVKITLSDDSHAGLVFDADGVFVEERIRGAKGTSIEEADLPVTITDYLAANYDGATIHKAILQSDGTYGVLLILADETYQGVGFDADGVFVAELSMKDRRGKRHSHKGGR